MAAVSAAVASALVSVAAGWPTPLEAPAEWLMEWTPLPIASFLLLHAGATAHPAALLGALALLLLAGGLAGAVAGPIPWVPVQAALASLLYAVSDLAFFGARLGESLAVLTVVFFLTFVSLCARRPAPDGRKEFLLRSLAVVGGAFILLGLSAVRPVLDPVAGRRLFAFRPPPGLPVADLTEPVTSVDRFYVMDKVLDYPYTRAAEWSLAVEGEAAHPLSFDLSALMALPAHHRYVTLECVDNPVGGLLMGNALWTGVRVRDLLRLAGATGTSAVFGAADNYSESLPLSVIGRVDPIIAYGMNGKTLDRAHGYPVRLVVPGLYGFKSVKWLSGIRLTAEAAPGEWAVHGWNEMPQIRTTARIDVARRRGDAVFLAGVAFAGVRGVRAVQARSDGGQWQNARLGRALSSESWVQWAVRMRCPEPCRVEVRAVDGEGHVQSAARHDAYPAGATGWDSVSL